MMTTSPSKTLLDKLWDAHLVTPETAAVPALLYVDLHLIHEVTSPQAFAELDARGLALRRPELTKATLDHSTPTTPADPEGQRTYINAQAQAQVDTLRHNCARHGVELFDFDSAHRGIVHVIGPELGLTQPGMTIVCGDSHTATHGAFGALAFGIGTSEVGHVLASQCLLQRKPQTLADHDRRCACAGRRRQGPDPARDRRDRGQRRHRPRHRIPRFNHSRDCRWTSA